jgi:hypothetical protein
MVGQASWHFRSANKQERPASSMRAFLVFEPIAFAIAANDWNAKLEASS